MVPGELFTLDTNDDLHGPILVCVSLVVSTGAVLALVFHQEVSQLVGVYLIANLHTAGWSTTGHLLHVACLVCS